DEFDAEGLELLILGPRDRLGYDAHHRERECLRPHGRPQRRVAHRGHDQRRRSALALQVFQQVRGAADLEAAGGRHELAFAIDLAPRKEIAQPNERRLQWNEHGWSPGRVEPQDTVPAGCLQGSDLLRSQPLLSTDRRAWYADRTCTAMYCRRSWPSKEPD